METVTLIFQILNLIVLAFSVWLIWKTLTKSHDWNRRKTTQEILDKLTIGEIPHLTSKLRIDFGCDLNDASNDYKSFISSRGDTLDKIRFDETLVRILNIFEVISIHMKNNVIEEDICYDYLTVFFEKFYFFSKDFIDFKAKESNDPRTLVNFCEYAINWTTKTGNYINSVNKTLKIEGKTKL